jgi:hypothetical protein
MTTTGPLIVVPQSKVVNVGIGQPSNIVVAPKHPTKIDIEVGTSGKPGPQGPEGGTPIIALPYDEWPPVDPQPNTLYLRLAP